MDEAAPTLVPAMQQGQQQQPGPCAFDWDIYKNRKTALQHLKNTGTHVDTVLISEDGGRELVHCQVVSALSEKLAHYISSHGEFINEQEPSEFMPETSSSSSRQMKISNTNNEKPFSEGHPSTSTSSGSIEVAKIIKDSMKLPDEKYTTNKSSLRAVILPQFNSRVLRILVDCSYTGYLQTDERGIWDVLQTADFYKMNDVIRACCSYLIEHLALDNCVKYYHIGIKYNHNLYRHAWHVIKFNFKNILDSNEDLPSMPFEHFESLLSNDRLNIDQEETVWYAIRRWCHYDFNKRKSFVTKLLPCIRFARIRSGPEFSDSVIWKDPLIKQDKFAQQQLALLDRNHRDYLLESKIFRDGYLLPCAPTPKQVRPRIPKAVLLALGGWQAGVPSNMVESYDFNCNMWFKVRHTMTISLAYHGVEVINKLLYICGGTDGTEILNELFVLDPLTGECHQRASMREARCYVATASIQGQLYAMGGHNGVQRMRTVERYDRHQNIWHPVTSMNAARSDASACVYKDKIYIAGGLNDQVIEPSVEFYNSQDKTWTFIESMASPRTSFTMLVYHDQLLSIGGNNGAERLSSVEQYSFRTKQWTLHSQMKSRRSTFSAALLDDRLIVVGGYNGQQPFNKVELYNDAQKCWVSMKSIEHDRSGLKVVVMNNMENAIEYTFLGHHNSDNAN